MPRLLQLTLAVTLLAGAAACSSNDDTDATNVTEVPTGTDPAPMNTGATESDETSTDDVDAGNDPAVDRDPERQGTRVDGRFVIDGLTFHGTLECSIVNSAEGTTVEVQGDGVVAAGEGVAQLRFVDSPPVIGDASLRITLVDRGEYRTEFSPTGTGVGEADDMFWEINENVFYLLGRVDLDDGTSVPIDIEAPCETLQAIGDRIEN